jgi:hypothetical protein
LRQRGHCPSSLCARPARRPLRAPGELGPLAFLGEATLGPGQLRARLLERAVRGGEGGLERCPGAFLGPFFESALEELDQGGVETEPPLPGARLERLLEGPGDASEEDLGVEAAHRSGGDDPR